MNEKTFTRNPKVLVIRKFFFGGIMKLKYVFTASPNPSFPSGKTKVVKKGFKGFSYDNQRIQGKTKTKKKQPAGVRLFVRQATHLHK